MSLHRLAFVNSAFLGATTITASSQQADLPASNLKSPARGALWRSAIGWNVVLNFNDIFLFGEGAGPTKRVATITPGSYVTGDDYATAVQAAMNAAPGAANTYTVTYSATTNMFTIARATGASAFSILGRFFGTSNEDKRSALRDLGFYQVPDATYIATFLTYTGSQAVHHSMEYVDLDQGLAAIRVVIVAGINDALDVKLGAAAPVVYSIAPGIYATPDELAAAVQDALDPSFSPLSSAIDCAWDPTTNKFTITNTTGGGVSFLFATGASAVAQTSAHSSLGFASTDYAISSGLSQEATSEVWGWNQLMVGAVTDHNAGGGGIYRVIRGNVAIIGQFYDSADASAGELALGGNELLRIALAPATVARRYIRLVIEDPRNEDAFSDLGILWAGPVSSAEDQDFSNGFVDCNDPKDVVNETEYGAVVGELRPAPHMFSGSADLLGNDEKDALQEMQDYTGLVRPIVFMRDALNAQRLISMTWYMRLTSRLEFTAGEGINDPSTTVNPFGASWSYSISLREIMP